MCFKKNDIMKCHDRYFKQKKGGVMSTELKLPYVIILMGELNE